MIHRLTLCVFVFAAALSAQLKIAVLNAQVAVIETAEIKKAQAQLEAKYKPRQEKIQALQKELQELQNKIQTGQNTLNQAALQDLQLQGQRKQRELQRDTEDLQAEVDRARNEILQRVSGRMQEVVTKIAEAQGYDLVLDQSNTIYRKPAIDITKEVIAAYDKQFPAAP